ncbi:uncharacterized protein LOC123453121 [Hordeum vulgare subsp. vulgare]|uniref:uncharacterized protein LOC123453121 n=1 Tax=Hordeum vulgare subsp. vulgare TaxID=112509 RepID=UPI001D1A4307|nr:uncharacterized protein LOC123453121 [Hordeum vulgare subsp. vulgare]
MHVKRNCICNSARRPLPPCPRVAPPRATRTAALLCSRPPTHLHSLPRRRRWPEPPGQRPARWLAAGLFLLSPVGGGGRGAPCLGRDAWRAQALVARRRILPATACWLFNVVAVGQRAEARWLRLGATFGDQIWLPAASGGPRWPPLSASCWPVRYGEGGRLAAVLPSREVARGWPPAGSGRMWCRRRPTARVSGGACSAAPVLGVHRATRVGQRTGVAVAPAVGGGVGRPVGWCLSWRLRGGSMDLHAATGLSGVGPSAFGPFRPSFHLGVARALLPSKGWLSPSCGPSLVLRPVQPDRARLAHSAAGPSSSRARCSRTEPVSSSVLQDQACLAFGAAGRVDGCQWWPTFRVATCGRRGIRGVAFGGGKCCPG